MEREYRLRFKIPKVQEVEVYFIRTEDGKIIARTQEEIEEERKKKEEKEEKRE